MGALYIAVPSNADARDWLREMNIPVADTSDGRLPTDDEIREALKRMSGYQVVYSEDNGTPQAEISSLPDPSSGPWASLGFPDKRNRLTFWKGWPEVMVPLLHSLSQTAGPLLLVPDTGGDPLLVYPAADPEEIAALVAGSVR
jgi:hypothetical protein